MRFDGQPADGTTIAVLYNGTAYLLRPGPNPIRAVARPDHHGGADIEWQPATQQLWISGNLTWEAVDLTEEVFDKVHEEVIRPGAQLTFHDSEWYPTRLTPLTTGAIALSSVGPTTRLEKRTPGASEVLATWTSELPTRIVTISPSGNHVGIIVTRDAQEDGSSPTP